MPFKPLNDLIDFAKMIVICRALLKKQRLRDDCRNVVQFTTVVMDGDLEASILKPVALQRARWMAKLINT